ncbi:MAG: hypothetical protein GF398_13830 [Chitinivibrionales bacterium]|nr:hypothetical protein [Chitinivibrionales bacterium]
MNAIIAIWICAAGLIAIYAALYYLRFCRRSWNAYALLGIRLALLIVLTLVIVKPSCTINRLSHPEAIIPLLVDGSQSMQMFDPDSLTAYITRLQNTAKELHLKVPLILFGDSSRAVASIDAEDFNDEHSSFPGHFANQRVDRAPLMIVLTDGNWSNTAIPYETVRNREIHFLELGSISVSDRTAMRLLDIPDATPQDEAASALIVLSGSRSADDTLLVVHRHGRHAERLHSTALRAGRFNDTLRIPLATDSVGRRLHKLHAVDAADSVIATASFVHTVIPEKFGIALYCAQPRLDKRFFALAIDRDSSWRRIDSATKPGEVNALVCFDWNRTARQKAASLGTPAVAACIGCLPEAAGSSPLQVRQVTLIAHDETPDVMRIQARRSIPAPDLILQGSWRTDPPLSLLDASVVYRFKGRTLADTVPIVLERSDMLIVGAAGIWKWDFLPAGINSAEQETFARALLDIMKAKLIRKSAGSFLVHRSSGSAVSQAQGLSLRLLFPATWTKIEKAEVAINLNDSAHKIHFDSTCSLALGGFFEKQVHFPPLPPGRYSLSATARTGALTQHYTDELIVFGHNHELMITGQNHSLLNRISHPLTPSKEAYVKLLSNKKQVLSSPRTSAMNISVRQTWHFLLAILVLFGAEWWIRKRRSLD